MFGSFADKAKAQAVLANAKKQLGSIAAGGKGAVAPKTYNGIKQWSAMILGLSQSAAGKACKALWAKDQYCLSLRPEVLGNEDMAWR